MQTEKCKICWRPYSPECDFNQGRCPHHPALIDVAKLQQMIKKLVSKQLKK